MTTNNKENNRAEASRNGEKVWFITGSSRGLGRIWATAALERGDKVVATARSKQSIADLEERFGSNVLTLELDVTNADQVHETLNKGHEHFGRLDVVVNNAAYSLVATIEEGDSESVRAMFETNVFAPLTVIKAALPLLRKQGGGHILGISSGLGQFVIPVIGYYCSSKWAFEAIHESLAAEVAQFGVKVTIIEPGAYATDFASENSAKYSQGMDVYQGFRSKILDGIMTSERGDPHATPQAIFKVVDAEQPPLRLFLGSKNLPHTRAVFAERLATWEAWADVANAAQGTPKVAEPAGA